MLLYRLGPDGRYAAGSSPDRLAWLLDDPFAVAAERWRSDGRVTLAEHEILPPVVPRQVVGVGRVYRDHAAELGNPMPAEPLLFAKPVSSLIGAGAAIRLPPDSAEVHFEGEIAVVVGRRLSRATADEAAAAVFGITAACDVTARDLQQRDKTFFRGKGFDTFCPLGPAVRVGGGLDDLAVVTRVNGEERQRGRVGQMAWAPAELLVWVTRVVTLEPGDVVLTGTPAGVGPLAAGDRVEVEVTGVPVLANPVEAPW